MGWNSKQIAFLLSFLLLLICGRSFAQTQPGERTDNDWVGYNTFTRLALIPVTVATLPPSPKNGQLAIVADGINSSSCTLGGGSSIVLCGFNSGTGVWEPRGGSGGGGSQTLQSTADFGRSVNNAVDSTTAVKIGNGTINWLIYCDSSNVCQFKPDTAADTVWDITATKKLLVTSAGTTLKTVDPAIGSGYVAEDKCLSADPTGTPASGSLRIYCKTDGFYYSQDSSGNTKLLSGLRAYWDAASLTPDGTNCTDATKVTINSGPTLYAMVCSDSSSSTFDGNLALPFALSTATFTLTVNDVDSSSQHFAGTFKAMCRNNGTTVDSTWGSTQTIDITMTTANVNYTGTTAAVTPNGTCSAGATLFWRFSVDAGTNTDDGDARIIGVLMKQAS